VKARPVLSPDTPVSTQTSAHPAIALAANYWRAPATVAHGFNEDFGFPNNLTLPVSPNSLLSPDERVLISVAGMLEAMKTGTTTIIENVGDIERDAQALADTGLRCVFAESFNDQEGDGAHRRREVSVRERLRRRAAPRSASSRREERARRCNPDRAGGTTSWPA